MYDVTSMIITTMRSGSLFSLIRLRAEARRAILDSLVERTAQQQQKREETKKHPLSLPNQ